MNTNPLVTSGLTIGAADLVPTVNWALGGFHGAAPANLSALLAGGIVLVLHAGYNWLVSRAAAKAKTATVPVATNPANVVMPAVSIPANAQQ